MSLAALIAAFQNSAIAQNGTLTEQGQDILRRLFTGQTLGEVRVFVAASRGLGHQASSVNILKRLIAFGCPGPIRVIYEVSDSDPNLPKLQILLPGFRPSDPGAPFTLNGVPLVFTAFTPGQPLGLQPAGLCVCGGSEDNRNYADEPWFNAALYLQLQPFQWSQGLNRLWRRGVADPIVLSEVPVLGGAGFIDHAFYMPAPEVSDQEWDTLFATFPNQNELHIAEMIDGYLQPDTDKTIDFLPIYGIKDNWTAGGTRGIPTLPGTAWGILFTITAAVAQAQTNRPQGQRLPTVIGVLTDVHPLSWTDFKEAVNGTLTSDGGSSFENAMNWAGTNGLPQRVVVLDRADPAAFDAAVRALAPNQILVVRIPGLPPDVFNLLYAEATLPFVFEGKGTANLALNLGVPYIHMAGTGESVYPSTFLGGGDLVTTMAGSLTNVVGTTQAWLGLWPANANQSPAARLGAFITDATTHGSPYRLYFHQIGEFYHAEQNDKLLMALLWSLQYLQQGQNAPVRALAMADTGPEPEPAGAEGDSPLAAFYGVLTGATRDGVLNLIPGAINKGVIFDFLTTVIGADSLTIGSGKTAVTIAFPAPYDAITVTGPTLSFGSGTLDSSIVFTLAENGTSLTAALTLKGTSFSFDGAPWFAVNDTTIAVTVSDNGQRIQGEVTGDFTLGTKAVSVSFAYPAGEGQLRLEGSFGDNPPSFNDVFQLLGGINFVPTLPAPLNNINSLALKDIQLAYDYEAVAVSGLNVGLTTLEDWPIFGKVILKKGAAITIIVASPTGTREVSWNAGGTIGIGPGTVELGIVYPDIVMTAQMTEGSEPIPLGDFLTFFLPPDVTLDLSADVTALSMSVKPVATPVYEVSGALDTDWPVKIGGETVFTLTGLSMDVQGVGAAPTGYVSAQTRIFPDRPDIAFDLSVTAAYRGKGAWAFSGELTDGTIKVVDILREYLPDGWVPSEIPSIDITVFKAKIESSGASDTRNSYEVGGKVQVWDVPFGDDITFQSSVEGKFGYRAAEAVSRNLGVPRLRTSPAAFPILAGDGTVVMATAAGDGPAKAGYYGEVVALITWANIELKLAYNFEPEVQKYQITWGVFVGTLEPKDIGGTTHWIASVGFTEDTTLGGIIETFISWATGSRFGLSAPWNVLNTIPLSNFSLEFDITAGTVAFRIDIGPIELGFARLEAIKVRYNNDKATPSDNGVQVEIEGSFRWQDDPSQPLGWDAAKPETTPAPPGNGNKYLDLRLLALGQHVTAGCFPTAVTVQKAIECMSTLPEPTPGTIPPITFDAASNWLIGTDFGVLRIEDGTDKGSYVVTLQVVFNDPNLYGLRLALAGDAAKIFKGLDFQIMYRKISENLGVYQAEITLPAIMRKIQAGAFTITLPVFAIQVYTNGDFLIDIGFPWKEDFSRSFTVEAVVPPGIPLIGSGGLYFGKLSSATTDKVPAATNGTFNPVIVFGFGAQVGLGKSIEAGILSAGFSLTVFGIIEGVLAKWNPYALTNTGSSPPDQLQGQYYFALTGTMGVIGRVYGSVDFAVVKAEVNIEIKLYAQIVFASYQDIPLSVVASVSVSARVTINLGLFKIRLSFSFSARIKETFVITTSHDAPWVVAPPANARLARPSWTRLKDSHENRRALRAVAVVPSWDRLLVPAAPLPLSGYCAPGLTVAGDTAASAAQQTPCYVLSLFIDSVPTADQDTRSSALKAAGAGTDTPFEALCKLVALWAVAAIQDTPYTPAAVGSLTVTEAQLQLLLDYLSDADNPTPLPRAAIDSFLKTQVAFAVQAADGAGEADAAFFPMPVDLALNIPDYGAWKGYSYRFTDYNSLSAGYLEDLRVYFDQLAVKVQEESGRNPALRLVVGEDDTSIADFLFADYFLLIMRQMVQAMSDGLRDFKYPIRPGDTGNTIVAWTNTTGGLAGGDRFSLGDLFLGNGDHALTAGKPLTIGGAAHQIQPGETFTGIAASAAYGGSFDATALATLNQDAAGIFQANATFTYNGQDVVVTGANSLSAVAAGLGTTVPALLAGSDVLTKAGLLAPLAALQVPPYRYTTVDGDTLTAIAGRQGVTVDDLADQQSGFDNGTVADLFSSASDANLDLAHLPAFQVDALLQEVQRSLAIQHLSGMVSRYYFSGLRLPTDGITPNARGMWVTDDGGTLTLPPDAGLFALSGQQFPLPDITAPDPFVINLDGFAALGWMTVPGGGDRFTLSVAPDSTDAKAIRSLKAYAAAKPLDVKATGLAGGAMVERAAASYPLSSSTLWQSTAGIALPYGSPQEMPTAVNVWTIPQAMAALPDPASRAVNPRFALSVERYDEASGVTRSTPVTDYGWASVAAFTVKRVIDQSASSPASLTTYEIVGAGGQDTVVLERLVTMLGGHDDALSGLALAYAGGSVTGAAGLQTDAPETLTLGVSQVNLSTVTRPPASRAMGVFAEGTASSQFPAMLNTPSEFIRLVWEASITRAGGFFLYYVNTETGAGLPDRIFNDKGEAVLSLIVLHAKPAADEAQNRLSDCMNAVVIGDRVDLSGASLVATSDGVGRDVPVDGGSSIGGLAYRYFANTADVATAAAALPLAAGAGLAVNSGVYMVSPAGSAPGGDPAAIAAYFGTSVAALQAANPRVTSWSAPLPAYTALRLPALTVTVGTSPGGGTLAAIAGYYGVSLIGLAADNAWKTGLFQAGQATITEGPVVLTSKTIPGVQAIAAARPVPPPVPDDPDAAGYAQDFLETAFSLLGYRVAANQDFTVSNLGLPVGPQAPADDGGDKIQVPVRVEDLDVWDYALSVPYTPLSVLPGGKTGVALAAGQSPYRGNGTLLQLDFSWRDLYGNLIVTTLGQPPAGSTGPFNRTPTLVGYTDELIALSRWPSVSANWRVAKDNGGTAGGTAAVQLLLTFSPDAYLSKQENPANGTDSWQENAARVLPTVQTLVYQLTDPNGIGFGLETSLVADPLPLAGAPAQGLVAWVQAIFSFLQDRAQGGQSVPVPSASPTPPLAVALDPVKVTAQQIFLLTLSFTIERTGGVFEGACGTLAGVRRTATLVAPAADSDGSGSLLAFAADFRAALSSAGVFSLNVATGVDRAAPSAAESPAAVWAVRLGAVPAQGISYRVRNSGSPIVLVPRPVSNTLVSRPGIPIYDYTSGTGIDWNTASRWIDFKDIDMDEWAGQLFSAVDGVLTPAFTSALLVVDDRTTTPAPGGKGYLGALLTLKEKLAGIAAELMIPVYADQPALPAEQLAAAQEAFRQQLLVALGNAYSVHAAAEFLADVTADVQEGPEATEPPNLYGTVGAETVSTVSLTAAKLTLATTAAAPATLVTLVSAPGVVKDESGAVREMLDVKNAVYTGSAIEHQIGGIPGIEGYQASSWLSLVEGPPPALNSDLGDFQIPMVLRSFPATPAMTDHTGRPSHPAAQDLDAILAWTYAFTYSLDYHYPQDRIYASVQFNIADANLRALAELSDAFPALAEFIMVFPAVRTDLVSRLARVDATTTDPVLIADAATAIKSFNEMVGNVVVQAEGGGLRAAALGPRIVGIAAEPYNFIVEESSSTIDGVEALVVTILGAPPDGIGTPSVAIASFTTTPLSSEPGVYSFSFTGSDGKPLEAAKGQAIGPRTILLPDMQVLQRQDAWSTVYLKRNEVLGGKAIAAPFVYQTPEVRFAAPFHPVLRSSQPVDVATLGSPDGTPRRRSLTDHLTALFSALFRNYVGGDVTIQVQAAYEYAVNPDLSPVSLPVLMQPPLSVSVEGGGEPSLTTLIADLSGAITLWFDSHRPVATQGTLAFELTIMSNLTKNPMPLVDLDDVSLAIQYVVPPLNTR